MKLGGRWKKRKEEDVTWERAEKLREFQRRTKARILKKTGYIPSMLVKGLEIEKYSYPTDRRKIKKWLGQGAN